MTKRENKLQDYHTKTKMDFRVTDQEKALLEEIGRKLGTKNNTETFKLLMAKEALEQERESRTEVRLKEPTLETEKQKPQSDIPTTELSLQQRAETNPALKDLLEACKRDEERRATTNSFPCSLLCRKAKGCLSHSMGVKDEIKRAGCYVSRFPYEWTTPKGEWVRVCPWMSFPSGSPNDVDDPYPTCIAKPKDVSIRQPKDGIMRNPEHCWACFLQRKEKRKAELEERYIKEDHTRALQDPFKGQPRVDYSSIESFDTFSLGDRD